MCVCVYWRISRKIPKLCCIRNIFEKILFLLQGRHLWFCRSSAYILLFLIKNHATFFVIFFYLWSFSNYSTKWFSNAPTLKGNFAPTTHEFLLLTNYVSNILASLYNSDFYFCNCLQSPAEIYPIIIKVEVHRVRFNLLHSCHQFPVNVGTLLLNFDLSTHGLLTGKGREKRTFTEIYQHSSTIFFLSRALEHESIASPLVKECFSIDLLSLFPQQ